MERYPLICQPYGHECTLGINPDFFRYLSIAGYGIRSVLHFSKYHVLFFFSTVLLLLVLFALNLSLSYSIQGLGYTIKIVNRSSVHEFDGINIVSSIPMSSRTHPDSLENWACHNWAVVWNEVIITTIMWIIWHLEILSLFLCYRENRFFTLLRNISWLKCLIFLTLFIDWGSKPRLLLTQRIFPNMSLHMELF